MPWANTRTNKDNVHSEPDSIVIQTIQNSDCIWRILLLLMPIHTHACISHNVQEMHRRCSRIHNPIRMSRIYAYIFWVLIHTRRHYCFMLSGCCLTQPVHLAMLEMQLHIAFVLRQISRTLRYIFCTFNLYILSSIWWSWLLADMERCRRHRLSLLKSHLHSLALCHMLQWVLWNSWIVNNRYVLYSNCREFNAHRTSSSRY